MEPGNDKIQFLTTTTTGWPRPTDPDEAITDFQAVAPETLFNTARQLRLLDGKFADWGVFRAVVHKIAGECLSNNLSFSKTTLGKQGSK